MIRRSLFLGLILLPAGLLAQAGHPPREASWVTPAVTAVGTHRDVFQSKTVGHEVSCLVYLPPDYKKSSDRRYPVMYWLHGIGGSQQGVPRILDHLNDAIKAGRAPAMIVVFVNGMIDSFYCDALNAPRPVESVIIKDLIPHIDSSYRTLATREGRLIEGFSMGGFGAGHLGFKYPELFGSVSMLDAALVDLGAMHGRHAEIFKRVWDGRDELFEAAEPITLLVKNADSIRGHTVIRQAVGMIVGPNQQLHRKLQELGIDSDYTETGARHNPNEVYDRLGEANWTFYTKAFAAALQPASP